MDEQEDMKEKMDAEVVERMEIVGTGVDRSGRIGKR